VKKKLFKDILNIEYVKGVVLLSLEGRILFKEFKEQPVHALERMDILSPVLSLRGILEPCKT